jgi:hypothetical protein
LSKFFRVFTQFTKLNQLTAIPPNKAPAFAVTHGYPLCEQATLRQISKLYRLYKVTWPGFILDLETSVERPKAAQAIDANSES